jgi:hemerythrin
MALMTWNESMSVGVQVLDEDHKKLIALLNELHEGILGGHSDEALGHVLDELFHYTRTHFLREEQYFQRTDYPGSSLHKKEHAKLMTTAGDLQKRFKTGSTTILSLETMNFLKGWVSHHILESDKAYGPHLNANGIH